MLRVLSAHEHEEKTGDCIDCEMCVQVCPTGIDIREGLQVECVACTQCIDACDEVPNRRLHYHMKTNQEHQNAPADDTHQPAYPPEAESRHAS